MPGLTFVGGILQALIGGSQNDVACNSHVVDEKPFVSSRSHHLGHGIIVSGINGPNASANEAVVIILLVEAVVGSGRATITRANINQAVGILGHATDQQVLIANLVPGHTVVVGFVDTTSHRADVNHTVRIALCIWGVVIQDGCGLTAHVVGTHANPIQRIVSRISRCRGLHCPEHVGGVNQARVLVGAKASHEVLRVHSRLRARHIVTAVVSDGELAEDQNCHHER